MLFGDLQALLPDDWSPMDIYQDRYTLVRLPHTSDEAEMIMEMMSGGFYHKIQAIYRLQNPMLYSKFYLKENEYRDRGTYDVKWLFHDTPRENLHSIAMYNVDWRYGERFKFGPGVYFSVSPFLANRHSNHNAGNLRTMCLMKVLVQHVQVTEGEIFLPDAGYDTVLCHRGETYVKYFDSEFYPLYFIDYISYCSSYSY